MGCRNVTGVDFGTKADRTDARDAAARYADQRAEMWGFMKEDDDDLANQSYTTVQTTVYRMEAKKVLRRFKKISHAHIFEPTITRDAARGRLIDELLDLIGGGTQPVMAHLVESGKLTLADIDEARAAIRKLAKKG